MRLGVLGVGVVGLMVLDLPSQNTYYCCFTNSPIKETEHRHDKTTFLKPAYRYHITTAKPQRNISCNLLMYDISAKLSNITCA